MPEQEPEVQARPIIVPVPVESIHQLIPRVIATMPAVGANQYNQQQQFKFRGIDDIMAALKPALAEHGVFWLPTVEERLYEPRTTSGNKVMHTVHLRVRFRFYGPAGDYVEAVGWGEGTDMGDKATNKAMTGAMKFVISQVFAVADAASDADHSAPEDTQAPPEDTQAPPEPPPLPEGWHDYEEATAAHRAATATIRALPDDIDRAPFEAYAAEHGWPMTRVALDELLTRVETATNDYLARVEVADAGRPFDEPTTQEPVAPETPPAPPPVPPPDRDEPEPESEAELNGGGRRKARSGR